MPNFGTGMASRFFRFHVASWWKTLLVGLLGVCILLAYFHHSGIGISPDAVNYLSTAEEWLRTGRFDNFHHQPLIDFPIGYPLWIACWMKLAAGIGLMHVSLASLMHLAVVSNIILFLILIFVSDALLQQFIHLKERHRLLLLSIFVTSPCLLEIYSYAWSETLFLPLCMLCLLWILKYLKQGSWMDLCIAALWCAMAWITRYAGIAMVLTGIFLIVFVSSERKYTLPKRLLHAFVFGCISASIMVVNLYRNRITGGFAAGPREKSLTSFAENLRQAGDVIADWWPVFNHQISMILIWIVLLCGVLCCLYFIKQKNYTAELGMMSMAMIYLFFITIIASITRFQTLDSRLLSPAYIPLLAGFAGGLHTLFARFVLHHKKRFRWFMLAGFVFWIAFQANNWIQNAENYDGIKDAGIPGYTEDGWQQSPAILYLIQHAGRLAQIPVWYSNADDAIYFFTRKQAYELPHKENLCERRLFEDEPQALIFWYDDADDPDLLEKTDLEKMPDVHLWKTFDGGAIYWKGSSLPHVLQSLR